MNLEAMQVVVYKDGQWHLRSDGFNALMEYILSDPDTVLDYYSEVERIDLDEVDLEGRHTERERMLAEMVLELCETFEGLFPSKTPTQPPPD